MKILKTYEGPPPIDMRLEFDEAIRLHDLLGRWQPGSIEEADFKKELCGMLFEELARRGRVDE